MAVSVNLYYWNWCIVHIVCVSYSMAIGICLVWPWRAYSHPAALPAGFLHE